MIDLDKSYLTGSWALKAHGLLTDREPGDIDIMSDDFKQYLKVQNTIVEVSSSRDLVETTNEDIYDYCEKYASLVVDCPLGKIKVAPLEILKVMKLSSLPLEKTKHHWDLQSLADVHLSKELIKLAEKRTNETKRRIEKEKFFNNYAIIRFIDHDELHRYVAAVPAYTKILNSSVEVCEEKFSKLSFEDKCLELFEETFVLAMERELILQYKQAPILLKSKIQDFKNTTDTNGPAMRWLSRLSMPGKVKDRPDWLAQWGQDNYHNFIKDFKPWWDLTLENLSEEFWTRFLKVKDLEPLKNDNHKDLSL